MATRGFTQEHVQNLIDEKYGIGEYKITGKYYRMGYKVEVQHKCGYTYETAPNSLLTNKNPEGRHYGECINCHPTSPFYKSFQNLVEIIKRRNFIFKFIHVVPSKCGISKDSYGILSKPCGCETKVRITAILDDLQTNTCYVCKRKKDLDALCRAEGFKYIGDISAAKNKLQFIHKCGYDQIFRHSNDVLSREGSLKCPECFDYSAHHAKRKGFNSREEMFTKLVAAKGDGSFKFLHLETESKKGNIAVKHETCGRILRNLSPTTFLESPNGCRCMTVKLDIDYGTENNRTLYSTSMFKQHVKQKSNGEFIFDDTYSTKRHKFWLKHSCGHRFKRGRTIILENVEDIKCPECGYHGAKVFGDVIHKIQEKYNISLEISKFNNPKTGGRLIFDMFLDDFNIAVEYDGTQHFAVGTRWFSDKIVQRDSMKNKLSKKHNIHLLRFDYTYRTKNLDEMILLIEQFIEKCSKSKHVLFETHSIERLQHKFDYRKLKRDKTKIKRSPKQMKLSLKDKINLRIENTFHLLTNVSDLKAMDNPTLQFRCVNCNEEFPKRYRLMLDKGIKCPTCKSKDKNHGKSVINKFLLEEQLKQAA